jgi:hypothetical protein
MNPVVRELPPGRLVKARSSTSVRLEPAVIDPFSKMVLEQ